MTVCVSALIANRMMQTGPPVFRFAPSPNGYLHLGHALSALLNFDAARARGGRFLLRIEDIDATRCRPEFETAIYEDLAWLGITWEEPVRRQSQHMSEYGEALRQAGARRAALSGVREPRARSPGWSGSERGGRAPWPRDPDGAPLYPGAAKSLAARRAEGADRQVARLTRCGSTWLRHARAAGSLTWHEEFAGYGGAPDQIIARPEQWGDVILARKEMPTSYHLSVVDRRCAAGRDACRARKGSVLVHQRSPSAADNCWGCPIPFYRHHRLVLDDAGQKLSKSTKATAIRELRAAGVTPDDIRRKVGLPST